MIRKDLDVYLGVFSSGRAGNVGPVQAIVGDATWYVGAGECAAYDAAGAARVVESGGLCESRNAALSDGWKCDLPSLIMSDDIRKCQKAYENAEGKKKAEDVNFSDVIDAMHDALFDTGAMLAGVAPTSNPFYWNPKRSTHACAFIVGDLNLVKPCDILFDEQFKLKEDYDYTLEHLNRYGVVARCDDMLVTFAHRSNSGGAVAVRTPELEQDMIALLRKKWGPNVIKDNAKRPDEILLNLRSFKPQG
jgi:hypothetical protein